MVELKFLPHVDPSAAAFTRPEDLETIYIPTEVMKNITRHFRRTYNLSRPQAKLAAELYLEEIYPQVLAHEAAHLALGHIAQEEGLPLTETINAYHNPIVDELEEIVDYDAQNRAVEKAQELSRTK